ncbi:hypothetical protein E1B28_008492 [Marasmius oreades]|uniref:Uncharacterized protein n=1 Tax=Marasmius oreades TaxID=181124 RepID=A0A9P7US66_9AGAR|nr:uncharacterized protein E1B28_008492 [Marasmius oreades]KAG7092118.1 hypothetical protein E1B28_008492 [Marasmius oreades]
MSFSRSLINLYGFILALGICQTALTAALSGDSVWSPEPGFSWFTELAEASHLVAYACTATVLSLCTWVWVSVLSVTPSPL